MTQPLIYPLFSTPVYVNNVGDFELPDIKSLEYSSGNSAGDSYNFLSSVDKNVLASSRIQARTRYRACSEVNSYARGLLGRKQEHRLLCHELVGQYPRRGHSAGPHVHNNSLLSGVLYLKVTEERRYRFSSRFHSLVPFPPALDLDMDSFNLYNCKSWAHKPKTNDICLFPSVCRTRRTQTSLTKRDGAWPSTCSCAATSARCTSSASSRTKASAASGT